MSPHKSERNALFALAIPMILSNITVPILGLVDTGVIGHLPEPYYLGATAVGSMVITFITWFCGFLRMSTSGLSAQAFGKGDANLSLMVLTRGLMVALIIGFSLIVLQYPYIEAFLWASGGSEQVVHYAREYSQIRVWGMPAALANLVILGWLLGMHKARLAMSLLIVTNLINLSLDLLFVLYFEWAVAGVAFATLIAEYSGTALGIYFIVLTLAPKQLNIHNNVSQLKQRLLNMVELKPYLQLNRDILIRTLCLELCFVFITLQGARLGDTVVAANAILMNFILLISFSLDGIAYAAEARVGRAKGANDHPALQLAVKTAMVYNLIFAVCYSVFFYLFGEQFILMLSNIDQVIAYAQVFLPWIIALPILACWCYLFDGIYIGLTQAKAMRNSMLISTFGCFFPAWFILKDYGNHALWAALLLFLTTRGVTLMWHYKKHNQRFIGQN
ncbi:MATE family efflux transporter [Thalassotalea aquiviva]|uniref:MATE family efflux transporter n=1 Tax=Thalassotalea aquiviva TaxID=3242415 RepID=UPI00352B5903